MPTRWIVAALLAAVLLTGCDVLADNLANLPGSEPSGAPADTGGIDAAALVDTRCTVCHTRERIDNKMASGAVHAAWIATVDRMIGYGAQLTMQERAALIEYLTANSQQAGAVTPVFLDGAALVEQRCTVCHTRARIDDEDGDREDWTELVDEMIRRGAQLTPDERLRVIDYLVATHGDHHDDNHDDDDHDDDDHDQGRDDDHDDD